MPSPWGPIALAAGVTAASTLALAQPIVSPRDVPAPAEQPAPAPSATKPAPSATKPAPAPAAAKPAPTATKPAPRSTKPARAAKTSRAGKSAQAAKSTRPGKSAKVAKAGKPRAAKSKASKPSRAQRPRTTKTAAPHAAAMSSATSTRTAAARASRGRGDNMPRGFTWPATSAMKAAGKACEAQLDALGVAWKPAAPEGRMVDAVELSSDEVGGVRYTSLWRSPPHKLDCQLARALAQIGPELRAAGVREVRWGSIYRWSNVRTQGKTFPFLSRHALGLAMDIVEFIDDAGRVANVQRDYLAGDALLAGVERAVNDSGKFRIVLTPRNDPKSHHDHFHIEANPDYAAP